MTATTPQADASSLQESPRARVRRTSPGIWAGAALLTALVTVGRFPTVSRQVEQQLLAGPMAEKFRTLPDADLAVSIGTVSALVMVIALQVITMAVAIVVERRTPQAGALTVAGRPLSLTFLVVVGTFLTVQIACLVLRLQPTSLESWQLAVGALAAVSSALAVRDARWGPGRRLGLAIVIAAACVLI